MLERWNNGRMQTFKKWKTVVCRSSTPVFHHSNIFMSVSSVVSRKEVASGEMKTIVQHNIYGGDVVRRRGG